MAGTRVGSGAILFGIGRIDLGMSLGKKGWNLNA